MRRLLTLALVGLFLLGVFSASAFAKGGGVKVMTRNQYLGADLTSLILAQSAEDFIVAAKDALAQTAANDFPSRAKRLATEVAFTRPDLIGLQEVFDFTVDGQNLGPPFVNHLDETLKALKDKGQRYVVAAILNNLDVTVPIEGTGNVRVLDRDVILVRKGIDFTPLAGDYSTGGLCGYEIPNPAADLPDFPDTLMSTPSEDGCNYTVFLQVPSPLGPTIKIERGFIGVDATVRGKTYRFVTTHLEQRQPDPTNPQSKIFQSLQSLELVGTLLHLTPPDLPLILLGDFNSCSEDVSGDIIPPYQIIAGAGFKDVWDTNPFTRFDPNGFTCCEFEDLSNIPSIQDERIDIVFVRGASFESRVFVTGRMPIFPLRQPPNWASDHSGVFGKLIFK